MGLPLGWAETPQTHSKEQSSLEDGPGREEGGIALDRRRWQQKTPSAAGWLPMAGINQPTSRRCLRSARGTLGGLEAGRRYSCSG